MVSLWFSNAVFRQIIRLLTNKLSGENSFAASALHHYHFIQKQMRYVPLCCLIFDINQG